MPKIVQNAITDISTQQLKSETKALFESIYTIDCYSTGDLKRYELYCRELVRRGYQLDEVKHLIIHK